MSNQIETQIDVSLTERNRVTALFRGILVLPALLYFFATEEKYYKFFNRFFYQRQRR
jgi:hypothetical protein